MTQTGRALERRDARRLPAAFTLRFHRPGDAAWQGGWTVNVSSSGAAFLAPDDASPQVGDEIEVAAPQALGLPAGLIGSGLPSLARVTRIDDEAGRTRLVAVAFRAADGVPPGRLVRPSEDAHIGAPKSAPIENVLLSRPAREPSSLPFV